MLIRLTKTEFLFTAIVLLGLVGQAHAADTLGINYQLVDNGGCKSIEHTISAEYRSEQGKRDVRGLVQTLSLIHI